MKQHILLTALLLAIVTHCVAQPAWRWARGDAGVSYNINPSYPRQVVATSGRGKSLWGDIQAKRATYGPVALGEYMLRELDSNGIATAGLAARGRFSLTDAQADGAGNWYVLGTFYDSVILSPSLRLGRDSFSNTPNCFLARLHDGTLSADWLVTIGSSTSTGAAAFCISGSSLIVPVDSFSSTAFMRYDAATGVATTMWTQGGSSRTTCIDADSAGNIYVTGNCIQSLSLIFNGTVSTPAPPSGKYPWYVARYHANGALHWYYFLTDVTCNARSFKPGSANAVYLTGTLSDSTRLGSTLFTKPAGFFNADFLMVRLDSNGNVVWAHQRPVTSSMQGSVSFASQYHLAIADTMLYMYCNTTGASTWGPGITTSNGTRNLATLVAYDASGGNAVWAKTVGGLQTLCQHIVSDGSSIWVTGNGSDSTGLKFDTASVPTTVGQYIPYVARMRVNTKTTGSSNPAGINHTAPAATAVSIYPNPAQHAITIARLAGDETICVRDMSGRIMLPTVGAKKANKVRVQTAELPRGMYLIEVSGAGGRTVTRIVLE